MRGTGGSLVDYSMRGEGRGEEEERGEGKEGQGAYYHKAAVQLQRTNLVGRDT